MKCMKYALAALTAMVLGANAALISISDAAYTEAGISTAGTLVGALKANNTTGAGTVSEGGFDWENTDATEANAGPIALSDGVSLSIFGSATATGSNGVAGNLTADSMFATGAADGTLSFSGLIAGQEYLFQLVASDTRDLGGEGIDIYWDQTDTSGIPDVSQDISGAGRLITASFTADIGGVQNVYTVATTGLYGDFDGIFSAVQLRAIPEPSTLGLVAVFGGGVLFTRRKLMI